MPTDAELTKAQYAAAVGRIADSLALQSGAGCGKTFVLARRYVELLQAAARAADAAPAAEGHEPASPVRNYVALTFTEKAALEMATRVRDMVAQAAWAARGPERARLQAWLEELPEARISTIHGFCASLLRARAIEAGLDPNFAVCADDFLVDRMISEAAEQATLQAVEAGRADVADLLGSLPLDQVTELVYRLVERRTDCDPAALTDPAATFDRWCRTVEQRRGQWLAPLADAAPRQEADALAKLTCRDPDDKLAAFRTEQLAMVAQILKCPAEASAGLFAGLQPKPGNIGSAKAWGGKDAVVEVRRRLRELLARVASFAPFAERPGPADRAAAEALAALAGLAAEAGRLYDADKRRRGLLDFTDLLAHTARLLRTHDELRKDLGREIHQLLIDECQDTDGFQRELLLSLIDGAGGAAPPNGRLFVVGDDKQSIYRFRGAQVEVFRDLCGLLGKDHQENLDRSFRTHEAGVAFVNDLFAPLMGDTYAPIVAHRTVNPPGESVEILLASGAVENGDADTGPEGPEKPRHSDAWASADRIASAEAASQAQAAVAAQRIADMVAAGERIVWDAHAQDWRAVRYGDVAILFSRMTNSLDYERQLQLRHVPYYVVAGTGFFQQQEVMDVLNALAAVDNPYDDIALVGVLRSSLFGLDDNTLMHLAEAHRPPYFAALRPGGAWHGHLAGGESPDLSGRLAPAQASALAGAVELIARLHRRKDAVGPDAILQCLLDETGYEATLLAQFQGPRMLSNVRMVADRARGAAAQHVALADFIAEMRQQVLSESRYEQAALAGEQEDVVRLMTIHKAKGLEFPVVVLPDLNAARRGGADRLLFRSDWGLTLKYARRGGPEKPSHSDGWASAANQGASSSAAASAAPAAATDEDEEELPVSYRLAKLLEDADAAAEDVRTLYVAATRHEDHLILVAADWRSAEGSLRGSDSYIAQIDRTLGVSAALAKGQATIPYGPGGRFRAAVRRVPARPADEAAAPAAPPGRKLLDQARSGADLAAALARSAGQAGPAAGLLGPLPASTGLVEIAVTALNDFRACPMLYRWRHELRVPTGFDTLHAGDGDWLRSGTPFPASVPVPISALDAATVGTLYHRCMELLDFARPQGPAALVAQAAGEMEIDDPAALAAAGAELGTILASFRGHRLSAELASARSVFRELDFLWSAGAVELRGQIDLLYQDAGGAWHVVDYKSDRVAGPAVAEHAAQYELQLLLYAAAAERHLGVRPVSAVLYFLRPAETADLPVTAATLAAAQGQVAELGRQLIESRRSGQFQRRQGRRCEPCPYSALCGRIGGSPSCAMGSPTKG